ncbi:hypothetical protein DFH11DRAFT_1629818 [Phellopilus nigrolimitatus]|nr:hypothetical protein DFH11DRAFT_1629818 [Phellopilus nigrolimitatus]
MGFPILDSRAENNKARIQAIKCGTNAKCVASASPARTRIASPASAPSTQPRIAIPAFARNVSNHRLPDRHLFQQGCTHHHRLVHQRPQHPQEIQPLRQRRAQRGGTIHRLGLLAGQDVHHHPAARQAQAIHHIPARKRCQRGRHERRVPLQGPRGLHIRQQGRRHHLRLVHQQYQQRRRRVVRRRPRQPRAHGQHRLQGGRVQAHHAAARKEPEIRKVRSREQPDRRQRRLCRSRLLYRRRLLHACQQGQRYHCPPVYRRQRHPKSGLRRPERSKRPPDLAGRGHAHRAALRGQENLYTLVSARTGRRHRRVRRERALHPSVYVNNTHTVGV